MHIPESVSEALGVEALLPEELTAAVIEARASVEESGDPDLSARFSLHLDYLFSEF